MPKSPRDAHRPSMRPELIASTLTLAKSGASVSLESAARAAGMTKAGVMYHFATKEALMTAVLSQLLDQYEQELTARLPSPGVGEPSVEERLIAYVSWAFDGQFDHADLVMFVDPRLRDTLTTLWSERISRWTRVPEGTPAREKARLHCARLIAEGYWFSVASNGIPVPDEDRKNVRQLALDLIGENK